MTESYAPESLLVGVLINQDSKYRSATAWVYQGVFEQKLGCRCFMWAARTHPDFNLVCLIDVVVSLLLTGYIKKLFVHSSWFFIEIYFTLPKSMKQSKPFHFPLCPAQKRWHQLLLQLSFPALLTAGFMRLKTSPHIR